MEWVIEEPQRGQTALTIVALAVAAYIVFAGRKKLILSVPSALVFLLFAAMAIPGVIPARLAAQRNACIHNLKIIRDAKLDWEKQRTLGQMAPTSNAVSQITGRVFPVCPRGGVYDVRGVGENPTCTLSNKGHRLN
jgi:hypothetical protein